MSDPRQGDRLREQPPKPGFILPTQVMDRIKGGLSPCDDELPFAQAMRSRKELQKAVEAFRNRTRA